jgi:hypothetical protein
MKFQNTNLTQYQTIQSPLNQLEMEKIKQKQARKRERNEKKNICEVNL